MKKDTYDIVICGSGAAGLLLALLLHQNPFFKDYSVLLIDAAIQNTNDRTWCFWEKQQGPLEAIVHHRWEHGLFKSPSFTQDLYLNPYTYKMIRGIDFYNHILPQLFQERIKAFFFSLQTIRNKRVPSIQGADFKAFQKEPVRSNQKRIGGRVRIPTMGPLANTPSPIPKKNK